MKLLLTLMFANLLSFYCCKGAVSEEIDCSFAENQHAASAGSAVVAPVSPALRYAKVAPALSPGFSFPIELSRPLKGMHCLKSDWQIRRENFELQYQMSEDRWIPEEDELFQAIRKESEKFKSDSLLERNLRLQKNGQLLMT